MTTPKYLNFVIEIHNKRYSIKNIKDEDLGILERIKVGAWSSWVLYLNTNCYMSASCLDEVREKIKTLNANQYKIGGFK